MINQLKAELFKLRRNKSFWVLSGTAIAISSLLHYLVMIDWWQLGNTTLDRAGLGELNGILPFVTLIFFNLFISTLAGFFLATEFSHDSVIKNQIISGSKRSIIYLAKYIVFSIASVIIAVVIPLIIGIISVFLLGFGEILTSSSLLFLGRAFSLFTLQFLGYTAIILFLAILTEDSGKTIIFSIIFTIVVFTIEKFISIPIISTIYQNTIFHQFSMVFDVSLTGAELMKSVIIAIISIGFVLSIGIFVFRKKDIK